MTRLSDKAKEMIKELESKPLFKEEEQSNFFTGYGRRVNLKEIPMENGDIMDMDDGLKYEYMNGDMNLVKCIIYEHKGHKVADRVSRTGIILSMKEFKEKYIFQ